MSAAGNGARNTNGGKKMEGTKTDAKAKAEITGKVRKALEHLRTAADLMDQAANLATWGMAKGDCLSYRERIRELASSDDGEAGLEALVDWLGSQGR